MDFFLKQDENLDLKITTYNILPISSEYGYIEFVPDSTTLYHIREGLKFSIQNYILEKNPKDIKISNIIFAVDEEVKTLQCNKNSKKSCQGKSVKCITHYLWLDLEQHIHNFFDRTNLSDLTRGKQSDLS